MLLTLFACSCSAPAEQPRVNLTLFVASKCPDAPKCEAFLRPVLQTVGSLVDLQLVPKADRKVDLPPAFADQLGFARVAREQSWSGYLFAEPVGEDGAYRVVSWSNEEPGRSLDTLTFTADGTVATGRIPLEAMRRRDRTAMFRSTPGNVVVVQYDAKERRLSLEQLPIE